MSSPPEDPSAQQALLLQAIQELRGLSAAVQLFTQAAAEQMGINPTDLQCLNVIHQLGTPTAGEVAARIGVTSGSMTGVIDRLERAGYVERLADPADRRRVRLRPTAKAGEQAARLFLPQLQSMSEAYAAYGPADLRLIIDFMERTRQMLAEQTSRLVTQRDQ